jgi:hypothetical protein
MSIAASNFTFRETICNFLKVSICPIYFCDVQVLINLTVKNLFTMVISIKENKVGG